MRVDVCVCVVCARVCERETDRQTDRQTEWESISVFHDLFPLLHILPTHSLLPLPASPERKKKIKNNLHLHHFNPPRRKSRPIPLHMNGWPAPPWQINSEVMWCPMSAHKGGLPSASIRGAGRAGRGRKNLVSSITLIGVAQAKKHTTWRLWRELRRPHTKRNSKHFFRLSVWQHLNYF